MNIQNGCIRIADIIPILEDICIADIPKLCAIEFVFLKQGKNLGQNI